MNYFCFVLIFALLLNCSIQTYFEGSLIEEPCQKNCFCRHKEKSSKIEVAQCTVGEKDKFVECNVEWPVLLLKIQKIRFNSDLLASCQRIKRLMITADSSLIVLTPEMFKLNVHLETLIVKAPIQTIENHFLKYFAALKQLDITETNIVMLSRAMFYDCPVIERIRLSSNQISIIGEKTFENCNRLNQLDLDNNKLIIIQRNTFNQGNNLEFLDLSKNQIVTIENFSFENLKQLKILNLERNHLKEIKNNNFHGLDNLNNLILSRNQLEFIEENSFRKLKSIKLINLEKNYLLRPDLVWFVNLENLSILINRVKCVDERNNDHLLVSMNVSKEFTKFSLCSGIRKRNVTVEQKKLIQNTVLSDGDEDNNIPTSQWKNRKTAMPTIFDLHPYLFPMIFGGLTVLLISIIVIAVVCHVKNQQINDLRLQEFQNLPMMQSTL